MSKRYAIVGDWQTSDRYTFTETDDGSVTLLRQYTDIMDRKNGDQYSQGAWRVVAKYDATGKSHTRAQTFYGESAWANSQRIYDDVIMKVRFGL